ncbi:MAG: FAD-binding oxidoreductase [Acidimicrobiia bacterium]|nr:FAD-binding oxidoreductase [Acidimicrobiia bacterium]
MTTPALLSTAYSERPLWQVQVAAPEPAAAPLPTTADVLVVGGGYCGLSAAHDLAQAGHSVVVCETEQLGFGASTRNGGMVIPELKAGPVTLEQRYGDLGRRMYREVHEAFDLIEKLAQLYDFDYERTGRLHLAHHRSKVEDVRAEVAEHIAAGEDARFLSGDELAAEIGSEVFPAGLLHEMTGALHPARFHAALVTRAADAGVELHPHTRVTSIARRRGGVFHVETARGPVDVAEVVVATNAYADGLIPALRRRVLPVGSYMIATEVLDVSVARAISPRGRMFVDTKNLLFYWRLTPDGRVAFGGRRSLRKGAVEDARDYLYRSMLRIHPQLQGVRIDHAWGGDVAMTLDRMPHFGRVDGILYATGCNGSGVALNTWMGTKAAEVILGGSPPAVADLVPRAIPFHRWRAAWLPAVGVWFRGEDRTLATRL